MTVMKVRTKVTTVAATLLLAGCNCSTAPTAIVPPGINEGRLKIPDTRAEPKFSGDAVEQLEIAKVDFARGLVVFKAPDGTQAAVDGNVAVGAEQARMIEVMSAGAVLESPDGRTRWILQQVPDGDGKTKTELTKLMLPPERRSFANANRTQ